jgi:hypothetical protein
MNIRPALNAVPIQEASSKPRCKYPRRSARPTLTSRPVKVAVMAPSNTPSNPEQWVRGDDGVRLDVGGAGVEGGVLKTESPPEVACLPEA